VCSVYVKGRNVSGGLASGFVCMGESGSSSDVGEIIRKVASGSNIRGAYSRVKDTMALLEEPIIRT
jgi:hypothetical protein